jgi:nitroimidazol reductase NimA-like FMN-containing flavoprotein (pyridoxamine 5'-phosphate oxidase superfamily)
VNDFAPTARSRVKRLHARGHYDRETVYAVIDAALVGTVAYVIDGEPYVTPTSVWREGDRLYWHGSSASRMLRSVKTAVPVSVNVFHLDGLVLARSGFHSSINYRSVTLFGHASAVTEKAEKLASLEAFVERLTPGRWAELRPVTDQELKATTVVAMTVDEASAKIRTGGPIDDEEDYALDIWAGVVPVRTAIDPPLPDERLKPDIAAPSYLCDIAIG